MGAAAWAAETIAAAAAMAEKVRLSGVIIV
jgi:hypothetical protein